MTVSIEVPKEVYDLASEIAREQGMSVPELIASMFGRHKADWETLRARARAGDRAKYFGVLDRVPDVEPDPRDRFRRR